MAVKIGVKVLALGAVPDLERFTAITPQIFMRGKMTN